MSQTLKFKTNINCGSCIKSVTGFIEDVDTIKKWAVDTDNPDKILTVEGESVQAAQVIEAVEDAGFDIELLQS